MLQLTAGASKFLTLGGVFVTSPAADYNADTFYFHTYDNWKTGLTIAKLIISQKYINPESFSYNGKFLTQKGSRGGLSGKFLAEC